jgi:NAD(P)H-dependent flavin oxidoreductase YrpB (nitropropane dioxygenase family)
MIATRVCDVLGITHPIVLAGMGGGTNPELVGAVSEAGGLGILACSWSEPDDIRAAIADIRARTARPFGVNFVLGQADPEKIELAIAERVPVISLFRGTDPTDIVARAHAAGLVVTHQVTTEEEARVSTAAGVDVLIAQGREAGGHMGPHPLWSLLPQVVAVAGEVPVLASGGLVSGRDLAAALAMGASGVHMGTRFLASVESPASDQHKCAIVAARDGGTVTSKMWDMLRGQDWPGVTVRALRNDFTLRWAGREDELAMSLGAVRTEFEAALTAQDHGRIAMLAGEGASRIEAIVPAAEIVRSVVAEAEIALQQAAALIRR